MKTSFLVAPVLFALFTFACSSESDPSSPSTDAGHDVATDTGSDASAADTGPDAPCPVPGPGASTNDPTCPATWTAARDLWFSGKSCSPIGLKCEYPYAGDGMCWNAALGQIVCVDATDAGADAGATGKWIKNQ